MKNVLTFLTVAMLAVATQAATISWMSGTMKQVAPDGSLLSVNQTAETTKVYLWILASQEAYDALDVNSIYDTYFSAPNVLKTDAPAPDVTAASSVKSGNFTLKTQAIIGETKYAAVIYAFTDSNGDTWIQANKGYTSINDLDKPVAEKSANLGTVGGFGATGWAKYEAVPEPTTVALLAFGLAAVGLKRKRA